MQLDSPPVPKIQWRISKPSDGFKGTVFSAPTFKEFPERGGPGMKNAKWEKVKAVLIKRRNALRQSLDGDIDYLSNAFKVVGDEVDAALDTTASEASSQLAEVESRELAEIEHALTRLNDGSYGKCEACSKAIAAARLQALPYATHCINCARLEERHRFTGGASAHFAELED
jgi:DnaK suppressor protein